MALVEYTVSESNYNIDDSITLIPGDQFILIGSVWKDFMGFTDFYVGAYSTAYNSISSLEGNFPPEIGKNDTYWKEMYLSQYTKLYKMKNNVQLNTPGVYTIRKGYNRNRGETTPYGTLTINVKANSPDIPVNINGSWKNAKASVNVNGTWKEVKEAYANVNGSWKKI